MKPFTPLHLISTICLSLFLMSCSASFIEKQSETADQGIYAIPAAIDAGRIDQADTISNDLKTLYPTPKNPLNIKPIVDPLTGINDIILPSRLIGKVIVIGSPAYKDLIKNKTINDQLVIENKNLTDYKTEAEKQKIADQQALNQLLIAYNKDEDSLKEWKASIFYKAYELYQFIGVLLTSLWVVIPLGIVGAIVLCVFCPAVAPVILSAAGTVVGFIIRVALNLINSIFSISTKLLTPTTPTTKS